LIEAKILKSEFEGIGLLAILKKKF